MKPGLKSIKECPDLHGKKVIVRLDLNVPMERGKIVDDFRILKVLPTLNFLREKGAISLVLSHLDAEGESLQPVADYLRLSFLRKQESSNDFLDPRVKPEDDRCVFIKDLFGDEAKQKISQARDGDIILFENIRQYPQEEQNDLVFAENIAQLGEVYVNDAFPVSHRQHASVVGVPKFLPHYIGFQFEEEIKHLSLHNDPPRPFLFILGGAKFDTKLPLIQKFLEKTDYCFVAGALANDFFKAKGYEVGISWVTKTPFDRKMLENPKLILPAEVLVKNGDKISAKSPDTLSKEDKIVDSGPKVLEQLQDLINSAKLILWNGPLGYYEDGFDQPTHELAKMISERTGNAKTIIGGGDTIAAIEKLGIKDKFTFVSTGGGAMLDFLLDDTLPGIESLK